MPTNERNVPKRYDFTDLGAWGTIGADDVGGVRYRGLDICDKLLRVSANIFDSNGDPLTASAELSVFFMKRSADRDLWAALGKGVVLWRTIKQSNFRSFAAGIDYGSTIARELTGTNFGQGWEIPSDWAAVSHRDDPEPPVLYVLWRSLTVSAGEFSASIVYKKGDC